MTITNGGSGAKIKVIYIAGYERSGSTVLAKALGELDTTFAAGELRNIWQRSFIDNIPCGCGLPFSECPHWNEIVARAFGDASQVHPRRIIARRERTTHLPLMLLPGGKRILASRFAEYLDTLDRLYRAIADVTGCSTIVDSSKSPAYSYMLRLVPSLDVHVVHLVRDPRGTQHSLLRRKLDGHPRYANHSVGRGTVAWDAKNVTLELLNVGRSKRYLRLRYEDFIADPTSAFEQVKLLINEPTLATPAVLDGMIQLQPNHMMGGSPNRHDTGAIRLGTDDRWLTEMDAGSRKTITRLAYPLLNHYGYQTRVTNAPLLSGEKA